MPHGNSVSGAEREPDLLMKAQLSAIRLWLPDSFAGRDLGLGHRADREPTTPGGVPERSEGGVGSLV